MRAVQQWRWGLVVVACLGRQAAAQGVLVQADGTLNLGYTQTTHGASQPDPMPQAPDVHATSEGGFVTEIRPGITLDGGSPRMTWLASYIFGANLSITGDQGTTYSNQAVAAVAMILSRYTTLTLSATFAQGGTAFLASNAPAESGKPEVRAPGNPALVGGSVVEALTWQANPHLALQHSLIASASAPENALNQYNSALTATLAIERPFPRDILGLEVHGNISFLQPQNAGIAPYYTLDDVLVGRWNHDFSPAWSSIVTAGVEQVFLDTGSKPLGFLPTGSASLRYTFGNVGAAVDFTHGTASNLQIGSVALTDALTVRGLVVLDEREKRVVSFSGGILHNTPIGDVSTVVAAGTGEAVQGDAGFTTALSRNIRGQIRYSVQYQFDQAGGLAPTLAHIFLIGVTGTYRNTDRAPQLMPKRGRRVDGSDSVGFPVVEDPVPNSADEDRSTQQQ